jgi:hypothetical protein
MYIYFELTVCYIFFENNSMFYLLLGQTCPFYSAACEIDFQSANSTNK